MKVKITGCPGCKKPIKAYDTHRAEVVCESCGLVISTNTEIVEPPFTKTEKLGSQIILNDTDYNPHFKEAFNHLRFTPESKYGDMKDWRQDQYYNYLMVLKSQYGSTQSQVEDVMFLIKKYSLKYFYEKGTDYEVILLHMLFVMMKFDQGNRLNGHIKSLSCKGKFNKSIYRVVCEKIKLVYHYK